MKLSISQYPAIAAHFVLFLFEVRNAAHIAHLRTKSQSEHEALGEFYKKLTGLTDAFAEAAIGQFGDLYWTNVEQQFGVDTSIDQLLDRVYSSLTDAVQKFPQEDLKNILTEMLQLTTTTKYKITLK